MPRGPKGEKRPADAIGNAIMIAKIVTGEIEDITTDGALIGRCPTSPDAKTLTAPTAGGGIGRKRRFDASPSPQSPLAGRKPAHRLAAPEVCLGPFLANLLVAPARPRRLHHPRR